jgi:hypothetical protein
MRRLVSTCEPPWKLRRQLKVAPGEELHEYVCNENEKSEHTVGKK